MTMCEDLDTQAEKYMRSVMNNDGDVFTRSDLYEYIIEAYKQGYSDCARVIPDTFGDTILSMNKVVLDATQEFRNRLNHKDNEPTRTTERARAHRQGT